MAPIENRGGYRPGAGRKPKAMILKDLDELNLQFRMYTDLIDRIHRKLGLEGTQHDDRFIALQDWVLEHEEEEDF